MSSLPANADRQVLSVRLAMLRQEHRDLDDAITALHAEARADALTLQRLKRQKLRLRDEIARIEDKITPDIIA